MKLCPNCKTKYPDDANFCPQEACATPEGPQRLQSISDEGRARFQPLNRLGGTSTGEVWKARDNDTGGEVAYKVVAVDVLPSPAAVARAEREFKQLMRAQSPKIATIVDCGKTADDRLFVAMELCSGDSLEKVLRAGPLPFERAKAIIAQIGQALLEAQKAGIVHRDVAPKNVLVSTSGDIKVINFPLARPVSDKVSGVPGYVSPEQAQGKPVDQRSNTYSLACIFYHLLTGEPPFQASTAQAVLDLHVSSPALPPSQRRPEANLSPDIDRVILKALDKNSSRRHLTLRLFLSEVEALSPPGAAMAAGGHGAPTGVGFAKTMLFAGGQKEVASLVAKAIAARTGTGHTPVQGVPVTAPAASVGPAAAAVASTMVATAGVPHAEHVPAPAPAPVSRLTPPPVTPMSGAPATASPSGGKIDPKTGFRETLWFKKGDVDQMVADAKAKLAANRPSSEVELPEDVRPLEDRYLDDGTVTTEDRKKFSLRTGGTATAMPSGGGKLPGDSMSESEVMHEIAGPRRTIILVVAGVLVAAVVVVVFMMLRGKSAEKTSELVPPAPTPAVVAAPPPRPTPPPAPPPAPAAAVAKEAESPAAKEAPAAPKKKHKRTTPASSSSSSGRHRGDRGR
jgi:eukaryotic-like serine/threonine-protein kinase